jgi:tetratricopeptide (TPR) repeat protein
MIKRLVISYSDNDREIAEEVHNQLAEAGYDVWIAHVDIRGSVDWTQSLLNAIDSCDGLVLVWSDTAAISEDVREEIRIARVFLKPIFPFLARRMKTIPSLPNEIKNLQVIQMGGFALNIAELKERLVDPERSNIQYTELAEHGFIPKAPNPYFIDRGRELKDLFVDSRGYRGVTKKGLPIAISGMAGIGKTQLALAFGYRFNLFFTDGVYWVDVPNGIVHEFGKIGPHLGVKRLQDERPYDYAIRVLEKLGQLREGLIIFDNVTNLTEFREWCPEGSTSCSVILTARISPRGFPTRVMNLTELDPDSAYELLIARREDGKEISRDKAQREALKELCRITGNHPLALELCASHLQSEFIKPSDYLKDIQPDPLGRLSDEKKSEVSLGAGTASLSEVLRHSYASLDEKLVDPYFLLMCCFAPHGINKDLIVQAYEEPGEGGLALDQLANISFIRRELLNTLSLHPLVAQFGRALQKQKDFDYPGKFAEVMLGFLRAHDNNLASEDVRREKPHIDEALRVAQDGELWEVCAHLHEYDADIKAGIQEQIDSLDKAYQIIEQHLPQQKRRLPGLRLRLGRAHRTAGRPREALADFNKAEVLYREIEDVDPAEAASLSFELGDTYLTLGQYAEAEKTLSDALKVASITFDNSAPEVLQLRQALAKHALNLGDYDTADAALTEILGYREKFYSAHPDATSAARLASVHADLSRLALARAHYADAIRAAEDALTITQEYYNESDPDCCHLYLLLGTIHYESGDYGPAEEQLDKARRDFLTTFGEGHPNYASALIALSEVYRKQGKFDKAETEVKRAIAIFERVYGDSHPFVAEALEVQGKIYDHRCEFDQEQLVWEHILEIQHRSYSEQHPALAATHYDYASLFLRRGEYDKAAEHLQSSLRITEESLGKTHADYFGRLVRLATCRYEQQEYLLAQGILDDAKGLQNAIFGNSPHPFIARMLQLQSEILRRQGEFDKALEAIEQAIAMKEAIYGTEEHPSVAEALEVKVKIFHHLGERIEAKLLIDRALEIRRKAYGENHPEVSRSIHDLGSYYLRLGQYAEAIEQFEQARQITAEVFGERHPDYVERTLNLANARNEQGEYQSALDLVEEVKGALPSGDHYLTARWLQLMGELQRRMGQFDTAMDCINRAIAMKKAIYGTENHPSVAEALEVQGKIYDHRGEFDQEQLVWEQVLEIQHKSYPEQHPALATTHYDYASLFLRRGEYDKAAEHLQSSLQITEQNFGKTHADYFGRLVRLATCRYEQQEYSQAQKVLKEAEDLQNAIFGDSSHPFIARMLQFQSEVLRRLGSFDEALKTIDQAIAMKKEIYGTEDHPSVAEALEVKAALALSQYQIPECGEILDNIERVRHSTYGDNHPAYADYQIHRAEWYSIIGRYKEAREVLTQALKTGLQALSAGHPTILRCQIMLAQLARMSDDIADAETRINNVYETLGARLETEDSLIVAEIYQELSHIGRAQGDYRAALAELEKALRIETKIFGSESPAVIELQNEKAKLLILFRRLTEANDVIESTLRNIEPDQPLYRRLKSDLLAQRGILQAHKGEYGQAIEDIEEAIKLKKVLLGDDHVELARLYIEKAVVLRHQRKYDQALAYLEAAHNIDNNLHFSENHVFFARILLEQGQTHLGRKSILAALELLKEAIEIYDTQRRRNVKERADAAAALGRLYLENGYLREASERFKEAMDIRTTIYGSSHPEIAETLYNQALLKMAETGDGEDMKTEARQKLEQALNMLRQRDDDNAELVSDIERTLADL